jgi:hypothetical protein
MTLKGFFVTGLSLMLGACGQNRQPQAPTNQGAPPPPVAPSVRVPSSSLSEPKSTIDPKSIEAAGQVVQHYGALIEQRRYVEAERLWGDAGNAADFTSELMRLPKIHLQIGRLGDMEGAAGSIYTTVLIVFYDDTFRRPANVILRRVNDVPGSTEEQRRWHIERIDWAG